MFHENSVKLTVFISWFEKLISPVHDIPAHVGIRFSILDWAWEEKRRVHEELGDVFLVVSSEGLIQGANERSQELSKELSLKYRHNSIRQAGVFGLTHVDTGLPYTIVPVLETEFLGKLLTPLIRPLFTSRLSS
jgi:hypothetical protein